MGSKRLSHFKVSRSRIRELYDTLGVCGPNENFGVLHKMSDVRNNIFWKYGGVRRRDDCYKHKLPLVSVKHSLAKAVFYPPPASKF